MPSGSSTSTDIMRRVKSKGNLIQLLVLLDQRLAVEVGAIQNRPVEQVLEARLEIADQVAVQEHFVGFPPRDVAMPHGGRRGPQ